MRAWPVSFLRLGGSSSRLLCTRMGVTKFTSIHVDDVIMTYLHACAYAAPLACGGRHSSAHNYVMRMSPRSSKFTFRLASVPDMENKKWHDGLKPCGRYYDGFVEEESLAGCLENHQRETASTFGTRTSNLKATQTQTKNVS